MKFTKSVSAFILAANLSMNYDPLTDSNLPTNLKKMIIENPKSTNCLVNAFDEGIKRSVQIEFNDALVASKISANLSYLMLLSIPKDPTKSLYAYYLFSVISDELLEKGANDFVNKYSKISFSIQLNQYVFCKQ